MLIKVSDRKYINSEKIDSLEIISGASKHSVCINMSNDNHSVALMDYNTLDEAEMVMDKLAKAINKTKGVGKYVEIL